MISDHLIIGLKYVPFVELVHMSIAQQCFYFSRGAVGYLFVTKGGGIVPPEQLSDIPIWRQMHTLILGSSQAMRLKQRLREEGLGHPGISAAGIPGGRVTSGRHRRLLLSMARARRPERVVLLIGGNDISDRDFDLPHLSDSLYTLGLGLLALGVGRVWLLPIVPRLRTRRGDVAPERYEQRRQAANRIMASRFRGPPLTMVNAEFTPGHLGPDGVHLSRAGGGYALSLVRALPQ